jgi:Uma2 family endonuclease
VECLSPANRKDAVDSLIADYEEIGVPEVWILVPEAPALSSHLHQQERLNENATFDSGRVAVNSLPGVEIELDELWRVFREGP